MKGEFRARTPWVHTRIFIAFGGAIPVERIFGAGATWIFTTEHLAVWGTIGVERVFRTGASLVFPSKPGAVGGTAHLERIRDTVRGASGVPSSVPGTIWGAVRMQRVPATGAPAVCACVNFTIRWTLLVERVTLTVRGATWIFIPETSAVRGAIFAQRIFSARTSRISTGKQGAICRTTDVERVHFAVRWTPRILVSKL